jgi:aryl-alcohol dehydrogenase-like predicted oxidoreductase
VLLTTRVGLGTAPLGSLESGPLWWGPQDRDESVRTVKAALDAGVGWIDTAPYYGWGRAEEIVGEAVRGLADPPLILTKCGSVPETDDPSTGAESIRREVEASLRRLGVERLDVLQIHDQDPVRPMEESWSTLMDLVQEGKIAAAGLSNHTVETMERAHAIGPVAVVQHQYSLLCRTPEQDGVLEWCDRHGVPFLAWSPLASGYLTDGFDLSVLHPDDLRHRLRWNQPEHRPVLEQLRSRMARCATEHGTTLAALAAAWVCRGSGRHAIVGARTPAEAQALRAVDDAADRAAACVDAELA